MGMTCDCRQSEEAPALGSWNRGGPPPHDRVVFLSPGEPLFRIQSTSVGPQREVVIMGMAYLCWFGVQRLTFPS